MPPEGQDISEHLAENYGMTQEQSAANRAMIAARLRARVRFQASAVHCLFHRWAKFVR